MALAPWVYAAAFLLGLAHMGILLYAWRLRDQDGGRSLPSQAREITDEGVECPECGVTNEVGYQFCRRCIAELPSGVGGGDSGPAPDGREMV